jgi:hypothetical protein
MSKEVVETVYGKHQKYEVIRETSTLLSPIYYVRSSDGTVSGKFASLADAVDYAQEKAKVK